MQAIISIVAIVVGCALLYTAARGLTGHDVAFPNKSGAVEIFTGNAARFVGLISLLLGGFLLYTGLAPFI